MSYYSQWIKSPKVSQVNWVCGSERILVDEVVNFIKAKVSPNVLNRSILDMSKSTSGDLSNVLNQHPIMASESSLILIQNAHKIEDLNCLKTWLRESKTIFPEVVVCLMSEEENIPDVTFLKPPKVSVVKCSKLSNENLVLWVKRNSPLSDRSARSLLEHVAGSLQDSHGLCRKLSATLQGKTLVNMPLEALLALTDETPSEFVDAIMSLDKARAYSAIKSMSSDEKYKVISTLDLRLTQLSKLQHLLTAKVTGSELSKIPGVPFPVVKELLPISRYYSSSRIVSCRQQLAIVDSYQNQGMYKGTLESLVALW